MTSSDTIVAISSAVGPAARIIVRASGPAAQSLARSIGADTTLGASTVSRQTLQFSGLSVPAWIYLFFAPHSYTGEDLIEFHLRGNPILAKMLLKELLRLGARHADPGEFTARAYFNGKMDLTAAEGVAATIAATGERELSAARQLLAGELARRLAPAMHLLTDTLALVEVAIDFSEEDVSFLTAGDLHERVTRADGLLENLLRDSARFERLAHEPHVVLIGRPNAGKSTLLNALAGRERAVVSPIAGTTRDVLSAEVTLARGTIRLSDVAGFDEHAEPAADEIQQKMRAHALREADAADVLVLVTDSTDSRAHQRLSRAPDLVVQSKFDLFPVAWASRPCGESPNMGGTPTPPATNLSQISISARTGAGMDDLKARLDAVCFGEVSVAASLALNLRHVRGIEEAREALERITAQLPLLRPELLAVEFREAIDALGAILGRVTPDDLLGRIFAGFCIGK
jgi:tRNA modification GTPase